MDPVPGTSVEPVEDRGEQGGRGTGRKGRCQGLLHASSQPWKSYFFRHMSFKL